MLRFAVEDISCGHCAKAITEALVALDPKARVQVDLSAKQVAVDTEARPEPVAAAITAAGYTPVPIAMAAAGGGPAPVKQLWLEARPKAGARASWR